MRKMLLVFSLLILWVPPVFAQTPHIVSTSPAQNQLNVPVNTSISVTFDIDMDQATFNDSTFVVNASFTGLHRGAITYISQTKTATLSPSRNFDVGEVVTVVLTTGIQSSQGFPLDSSFAWSFTTIVTDGGGAFVTDSTYPAGSSPGDAAAADIDNDGDVDLVIVNRGSNNVSVLLNNGDGTFTPDSTYPVGSLPSAIAAADLDRDGDIDLAVTTNAGSPCYISVLLNNGDGTFAPQSSYSVGLNGLSSICAADLNGDGYLDLFVTICGYHLGVSVLLNNGDGTFPHYVKYHTSECPFYVIPADLDNDGDIDLVTADHNNDPCLSILFNNGDGTFGPCYQYSAGYPKTVSAGDLNGDGSLDLVTGNTPANNIYVLLNNGDGTFVLQSSYPMGSNPCRVSTSDLDGDGDLDLVTGTGSKDLRVLLNNGDGTFAPYSSFPIDYCCGFYSCVADFDGDGDLDVGTENYYANNASIILNFRRGYANGDGNINSADVSYLINYLFISGPAPHPWQAGDANCDGSINSADVAYLINYLFISGPPPSC